MSALFLTGTSLKAPSISVWAVGLVLMKAGNVRVGPGPKHSLDLFIFHDFPVWNPLFSMGLYLVRRDEAQDSSGGDLCIFELCICQCYGTIGRLAGGVWKNKWRERECVVHKIALISWNQTNQTLNLLEMEIFWNGRGAQSKTLHDFTFFYGAIPTSSAPIVFASQFDPEATELIATAVLFGLILAGPIMFITAYFLSLKGI